MRVQLKDDLHPEDSAMLQALISRDPGPLESRLKKLGESDSGRFMERYYVGYGHASIGDCASTTLYIEDISLYAAKAVEDHARFNGQESSTRYLDFSSQGLTEYASAPQRALFDDYIRDYQQAYEGARDYLRRQYPDNNGIDACAFDAARSLIPLGAKTTVAWTTTLTGFRFHLLDMAIHPLQEVRDIAEQCWYQLREHCPHSFHPRPQDDPHFVDTEGHRYGRWIQPPSWRLLCDHLHELGADPYRPGVCHFSSDINPEILQEAVSPSGHIHWWANDAGGRVRYLQLIDFGSYRDLHRHRLANTPIPMEIFSHKPFILFNDGDRYRQFLKPILGEAFIERNRRRVGDQVPTEDFQSLYTLPLGLKFPGMLEAGVSELYYILRLRSGRGVHPTLREYVLNLHQQLGANIQHYFDVNPYPAQFIPFDKRAEQTIKERS